MGVNKKIKNLSLFFSNKSCRGAHEQKKKSNKFDMCLMLRVETFKQFLQQKKKILTKLECFISTGKKFLNFGSVFLFCVKRFSSFLTLLGEAHVFIKTLQAEI